MGINIVPALPHVQAGSLQVGEVHLWQFDWQTVAQRPLWPLLSDYERQQALQRLDPYARRCYGACRAVLKVLLAAYEGLESQEITLAYSAARRPYLENTKQNLTFSLSHSGPKALFAFALERSIGVDLEKMDETFAYHTVVAEFLSPEEINYIGGQAPEHRRAIVYHFWTLKEAYLKARGQGFLESAKDLSLLSCVKDRGLAEQQALCVEGKAWFFYALNELSGYSSTLLVDGDRMPSWRCFNFSLS